MDKSSVYFATKSDETCCNWKSYFLYVTKLNALQICILITFHFPILLSSVYNVIEHVC